MLPAEFTGQIVIVGYAGGVSRVPDTHGRDRSYCGRAEAYVPFVGTYRQLRSNLGMIHSLMWVAAAPPWARPSRLSGEGTKSQFLSYRTYS